MITSAIQCDRSECDISFRLQFQSDPDQSIPASVLIQSRTNDSKEGRSMNVQQNGGCLARPAFLRRTKYFVGWHRVCVSQWTYSMLTRVTPRSESVVTLSLAFCNSSLEFGISPVLIC